MSLGETSPGQLVDVLRASGFRPKRGDGLVKLGELELLQLLYEPADALVAVQVDLLLARDAYQSEALARRVHLEVSEFGMQIDVLACEDLIINKLAAGRMIDLADAAALIRANRSSLDLRYLLHWIDEKRLNAEFAQVWREGCPDEPVPAIK